MKKVCGKTRNKKNAEKHGFENKIQRISFLTIILGLLFVAMILMATRPSAHGVFAQVASAQEASASENGFFQIPPPENFGNPPHPADIKAKGTDIIMQLAYGIYNNLKGIISGLAIAFLIFSGFMMVTANNEEQTITEQKNHMLWSFIGLILLAITHGIQKIFECRIVGGTQTLCIFQDPTEIVRRVGYFDKQLEIVLTFGRYIIGSIAVLYLVLAATRLIIGGENDETATKEKKNFGAILIGLIVIIVSDFLINDVLYILHKKSTPIVGQGVNPGIATDKGLEFLGQLSRFVVSFAGPIALLMLVVAGFIYVSAAGQDEQMNTAKTILRDTIIGLIIIYGAYALVATVIAGRIEGI